MKTFYVLIITILTLSGCDVQLPTAKVANDSHSSNLALQGYERFSNKAERTFRWTVPASLTSANFRLALAADNICKDILLETTTSSTEASLTLPKEGKFAVCLYAEGSNGERIEAVPNGEVVVLDLSSPILTPPERALIQGKGTVTISATDLTEVSCHWSSDSLQIEETLSIFTESVEAPRDGAFTLVATCADQAGNKASTTISVVSDTVPPAFYGVGVQVPKLLTLNAAADAHEMQISLDSTCLENGKWQAFAVQSDFAWLALDTPISARVRDAAGNMSPCKHLIMTKGKTGPLPPSLVTFKSAMSKISFADIRWTASVDTSVVSYDSKLCQLSDCSGTCSSPFSSTALATHTPSSDGRYYACVRSQNDFGLVSDWVASSTQVLVDSLSPVVNLGPDRVSGTSIEIKPAVTEANPSSYAWTQISGPQGGVMTFSAATAKDSTLSANKDGEYLIRLTVTDAVGRTGSDDVILNWNFGASIATANGRTCRIYEDGLRCWGSNADNVNLANGNRMPAFAPLNQPIAFPAGVKPTVVRITNNDSCVITNLGTVTCWGYNGEGIGGNGSTGFVFTPPTTPIDLGPGRTAMDLGVGVVFVCVLLDDKTVKCWGRNSAGQTGSGLTGNVMRPPATPVSLGQNVKALTVAHSSACAILDDGSIRCWGNNEYGALGAGDLVNRSTPGPAFFLAGKKAVKISGGNNTVCAIAEDGSEYCWGYNTNGTAGNGTNTNLTAVPAIPLYFGSGRKVVRTTVNDSSACAILDTGEARCWGYNTNGALGLGGVVPATLISPPVSAINVGVGRTVLAFATGPTALHTCALLDDLKMRCWGTNSTGELGLGESDTKGTVPAATIDFGVNRTVLAIETSTSGLGHTCAILDGHELQCWGDNSYGQLGYGDTVRRGTPMGAINLGAGRSARSVSLSAYTTCAVLDDFTLKCWGYNGHGELGYADVTQRLSPEPTAVASLGGSTGVKSVIAANNHTCAIRLDGKVYCWGVGTSGELGDGLASHATPGLVDLGVGRTAVELVTNVRSTCARLDNFTVKCWGADAGGNLGTGVAGALAAPPSTPINLGINRTATKIVAGYSHVCALLDDGHAKCWGYGPSAALGLEDVINLFVPEDLPIDFGNGRKAKDIAAGDRTTCVVLTDDKVKCFGGGANGMIGNGYIENGSSFSTTEYAPVNEAVKAINARGTHVCVLLATDKAKCWGRGFRGQLGYGLPNYYFAPDLTKDIVISP